MPRRSVHLIQIPSSQQKSIDTIVAYHAGAPDDIYFRMIALESDYEVAVRSGGNGSKELAALQKFAEESRPAIESMRKDYQSIRKGTLPQAILLPIRQTPVVRQESLTTGQAIFTKELSTFDKPWPPMPSSSNNFELMLTQINASQPWNTTCSSVAEDGYIGWSKTHGPLPTISNMNGKGIIQGDLSLRWTGTVPEDDLYRMMPNISIEFNGECFADGYAKPGIDAVAKVSVHSMITVDATIIAESSLDLCSVKSRLLPISEPFAGWLALQSNLLFFRALKGQQIDISVRLFGKTWTRGKADAEICIDLFGVPSNTITDTAIPVES